MVQFILGLKSTIPDGSGRTGRGQAENKTNSAQLELGLGLSLAILNLETLKERRENLCIKFAQKCTENEKLKHWFPLKKVKGMKTRKQEKFKVFKASSKRYKNSAIPFMRRLLNKENLKKKQTMKY